MTISHSTLIVLFISMSTGYTACSLFDSSQGRKTRLHRAAEDGNLDKCKTLLEKGRPVNALDETRNSPLHYAAHKGRYKVCMLLLQHATDDLVGLVNQYGNTALHYAASRGNYRICLLLKEHGASLLATNNKGQRPYDCIPANTGPSYVDRYQYSETMIFDFELSSLSELGDLLRPPSTPKTPPTIEPLQPLCSENCLSSDDDSHVTNVRRPLHTHTETSVEGFWTSHQNEVNFQESFVPTQGE